MTNVFGLCFTLDIGEGYITQDETILELHGNRYTIWYGCINSKGEYNTTV